MSNGGKYVIEVKTEKGGYHNYAWNREDVARRVWINALAFFNDTNLEAERFEIKVTQAKRLQDFPEKPMDVYHRKLKNDYAEALTEIKVLKSCIELLERRLGEYEAKH